MDKKKRRRIVASAVLLFAVLGAVFFLLSGCSDAGPAAREALRSGGTVTVSGTDYGWFFDGPSESDLLVFYPGGLVEAEAYAPLLRTLAEEGMDVCLVRMPLRLAVFGMNKADAILPACEGKRCFIGGHSLGGAVAANYASEHGDSLTGLILLAAYPTHELDDSLIEISIRGSEDGVLNTDKVEAGRQFAPDAFYEYVIEGGNHAQFGDYGPQRGDGTAFVTAEEQQAAAAAFIIEKAEG